MKLWNISHYENYDFCQLPLENRRNLWTDLALKLSEVSPLVFLVLVLYMSPRRSSNNMSCDLTWKARQRRWNLRSSANTIAYNRIRSVSQKYPSSPDVYNNNQLP